MPNTRKTMVLAASVAIFACCACFFLGGFVGMVATLGRSDSIPLVSSAGKVTLKQYDSIQWGHDYGDVVKIVGREGKLIWQENRDCQRFIWTNSDGSNFTADFVAGHFSEKKQSGLK